MTEFDRLSGFGQLAKLAYDNREVLQKVLFTPPTPPRGDTVSVRLVRHWGAEIHDALFQMDDPEGIDEGIRRLEAVDKEIEDVLRSRNEPKSHSAHRDSGMREKHVDH